MLVLDLTVRSTPRSSQIFGRVLWERAALMVIVIVRVLGLRFAMGYLILTFWTVWPDDGFISHLPHGPFAEK